MTDEYEKDELKEQDPVKRANAEAAGWYLRFANGEAEESDTAFIDWLSASSLNQEAMDRARETWDLFSENAVSPEIVRIRRDALDRSGKVAARRWSSFNRIPNAVKAIAAVIALAMVAIPALYLTGSQRDDVSIESATIVELFETEIGETRIVTLADNSRVSLDASTRLSVEYSSEARDILLKAGQAHFDVAEDKSRPFRVTAGDQTVLATGTAFNVEIVGDQVLVTLLEGEVVVSDARNDGRVLNEETITPVLTSSVKLRPGEQLLASANEPSQIDRAANIEKTNAWRDGKVFLEGDSLDAAVARMNRYSRIEMSVQGNGLDELRISGVFNARDTDAFIEAVEALFPVEARRVTASSIEFHART